MEACGQVSAHYLEGQTTDRSIRAVLTGQIRSNVWWKPRCLLIPAEFNFGLFMDVVVISNIVILGVQADYSDWSGWMLVDFLYAFLFVSEIIFKVCFHRWKMCEVKAELRSFLFDLLLAALSIFDVLTSYIDSSSAGQNNYTWMRIARLVRIARILRLMHLDIFSDLLLMISGAVGGLRTLGWSIVMIAVPIYVFALFFTEMVGKHPEIQGDDVQNNFSSIGMSMFTGFRCLVAGDCSQPNGTPIFVHLVIDYGWSYGVFYALTSVCMSFGLFNVIVAIYVENTVDAAKSNELIQRQRRLEDQQRFAHKIVSLVHYLWSQHDEWHPGLIFTLQEALELEVTEEMYRSASQLPELQHLLLELDVPKEDMSDLFEICDADDSGVVTVDELVAGIKKLRGDPRRSDIVYVMLRIEQVLNTLQRVAPPDELCADKAVSSIMTEMLE